MVIEFTFIYILLAPEPRPACPPVITCPPVVECPSVTEVTCPTQPPATPPAQVESVDVFYDEDEGTKLVMWNPPEGEVTAYSIRISYSENGFTRRQFSSSENPWIQLRLADLPFQRPLWVEVLGYSKISFTN